MIESLNILDPRQCCANCRFNDGMVYTSYPVKYRCTIDNNYYDGLHPCHFEFVPVVRCKDCIHYYDETCLKIYSDGNISEDAIQLRKPDDFCSYGKKE